jgi:hypothetical protein
MGFEDLLKEILKGSMEPPQRPATPGGAPRGASPQGQKPTAAPAPRSTPGPRPVPTPEDATGLGPVVHSVVQIVALRQGFLGSMSSAWTGSGTIVDPSGIILTNCHVANPRAMGISSPPADRLGIAVTERADDPPALSYFAEVAAFDPDLDLAVLRIVADVRGRRVSDLSLPALPLGDSDSLELGDRISIFGYPGIGGETVTFTSGNVSGFRREEQVRASRAWIKTDATIAGGNSGGTAVNEHGALVGIPTQAAAGSGVTPVDARPVLDTNRDGVIDERDTPMAIGGFINGLRPVNLALPLLEKAGAHLQIGRSGAAPARRPPAPRPSAPVPPSTPPRFSELLFCTRVTDDGRPINATDLVPTGNDTVYATFVYEGMQDGMPWSMVWMSGGKQIIDQQDQWHDGPPGRKAVKINNRKGLPEGEYHLVLGIGGTVALEGKVMVGNPIDETDSEISGQLVDGQSGKPIGEALVLVLKPQASLQKFLATQDRSLVFSTAQTGADGRFTFPEQLPKGQAYSLVAVARGYAPLAVEGALRVSAKAPEHADIGKIEMSTGFLSGF